VYNFGLFLVEALNPLVNAAATHWHEQTTLFHLLHGYQERELDMAALFGMPLCGLPDMRVVTHPPESPANKTGAAAQMYMDHQADTLVLDPETLDAYYGRKLTESKSEPESTKNMYLSTRDLVGPSLENKSTSSVYYESASAMVPDASQRVHILSQAVVPAAYYSATSFPSAGVSSNQPPQLQQANKSGTASVESKQTIYMSQHPSGHPESLALSTAVSVSVAASAHGHPSNYHVRDHDDEYSIDFAEHKYEEVLPDPYTAWLHSVRVDCVIDDVPVLNHTFMDWLARWCTRIRPQDRPSMRMVACLLRTLATQANCAQLPGKTGG
jgi:hypothetical protein